MSAIKSAAFSRPARIGAVLAVAGAALVAVAPPSLAVASSSTLSAYSGPAGGGNSITITSPTAVFGTGNTVVFQYSATTTAPLATTCGATYATVPVANIAGATAAATTGAVAVASPKVLSSTKLAVTIPSGATTAGGLNIPSGSTAASLNFTVCVYSGTGSATLLSYGKLKYAIAAAPTVSSVSPTGSAALGGGTITVNGGNFINGATTATLGGLPLTGISWVSASSFTATVPAHAAGPVTLSVTTTGGTVNKANYFTYSDGLIISPVTTATNTAATDLDIQGVGFTDKNFTTTTGSKSNDGNAHVYLVQGAYDPTLLDDDSDDATPSVKTNGELAECTNVLVISDTELICTVDTGNSLNAVGANAFQRVVTDGLTATDTSLVSATAKFDQDDVGKLVSGTGIAGGTHIESVTNATTVVLDAATTATGTASVTIGADNATNAADIANGTYTVTVVSDGRPGATATAAQTRTNANYAQSIISSGSTFTVAPY
jgi:hypothetical protein